MCRVDFKVLDHSGYSETNEDPVVSGLASSSGFPTIPHVHASTRRQNDPWVPIMRVIETGDPTTIFDR